MSSHILPQRPTSGPQDQLNRGLFLRIIALCFTIMIGTAHYNDYSPLIPSLEAQLHITSALVGLFSTTFFLGVITGNVFGGVLADYFGTRTVLLGSTMLLALGGLGLPLVNSLPWMLCCRMMAGLGSGGAFIACTGIAAGLGRYAFLSLGLNGGAVQAGSGLGLLLTPIVYAHVGWHGAFLFWGCFSVLPFVFWLFLPLDEALHISTKNDVKLAIRSPALWTLGLSHMGTGNLVTTISAWITLYLINLYHVPLALAAALGSFGLLPGIFLRPLGSILLMRRWLSAIALIRLAVGMCCLGVALLALPLHLLPLACAGLLLLAVGSAIPFAAIYGTAAQIRGIGKGTGQGFVSVIASPVLLLGPPLVGLLLDATGNFSIAFGSIVGLSSFALVASWLAGFAIKREGS